MARRLGVLFLALVVWLSATPAFSQAGQRQASSRPIPRRPDGRVDFGPPPGEKGHWIRMGRSQLANNPNAVLGAGTGGLPANLAIAEVPFQPWARALYESRQANEERDAPHARCKPSPGPRQIGTAYGFEILDVPELQRVFIFDIGGPHSFRVVFMDGRSHAGELEPAYGHSIGRWDGDTLVVDTTGFSEKSWIDAEGMPHTEQYSQIERFTRTEFGALKYEVTIADPGVYTKTWTGGFFLRWNDGAELFEYICQDNNLNPEMTIDAAGAPILRARVVTP